MRPLDIEKEIIQLLNDEHPEIQILGFTYRAGDILAEMDPVALRCEANDWADAMVSDGTWTYLDGEYYLTSDVEDEAS